MKNTFAVSMTLLLALTLGGSFAAFQRATTPHQAEAGHGGTEGAAGEGHGEGEAGKNMEGTKGDDVVTDTEAAVNAGEGDPWPRRVERDPMWFRTATLPNCRTTPGAQRGRHRSGARNRNRGG
ncbi:hypothetical protein ACFSC4_04900 [Deinococcus malanensis]|uniref:hypothetical protein n=1 Tax=Deinococcus malanensis TaxID=1706855 RepID=UPI00363961D4